MVIFLWWDVVNLADYLVELFQGGAGHSFKGEVVPVKYDSWKEWKIVVISRSNYQPVGQRVDNVEMDLQVGLESKKWGWQLENEWCYT